MGELGAGSQSRLEALQSGEITQRLPVLKQILGVDQVRCRIHIPLYALAASALPVVLCVSGKILPNSPNHAHSCWRRMHSWRTE
jgi:hypothetical protein